MHTQPTPKRSVEDAPLNAFHRKLTVFSSGGPFLDGYVLSIIGVVMLQISSALSLTAFWEGLIAASALIGVFIGGFFGGWFTDRFGRKVLYLVDLIAIVGFSLAQFWVESAWMLFVWRLLIGIAVGADYPIATSLLAEFLPRKQRGPLLAAMVMMWFAGAAVAYLVGELLLKFGGEEAWRWVLASALVPGALFLLARSGTPESPRWLLSKGRVAEADAVIKQVYGPEYGVADLPEPANERQVSVWSLFHSGYGKRMTFITVFWSCAIIPLFAIYAFAPKVLQALGLTGDWASYGSIAITVLFTVGCLGGTLLINRLGRRNMLIQSFLWSGAALALLGLFPDASPALVLLMFGSYAVFIGGAQVLEYVYPNELFPTEIRASAVGLATSLSRVGAAVGTYLVPISLSEIGIGNTMLVAAGISLFGALASWIMAPETSTLDLQQAASLGSEGSPRPAKAAPRPVNSPEYKENPMSNVLTVVRNADHAELGEPSPARLPIGEVIAQARTAQDQTSEAVGASIGIWESSPGVFRRHLKNREFSHIISGWCIFTPDGGEPVKLSAGDAVLFPENCEGVWDIRENFRKTYVLF